MNPRRGFTLIELIITLVIMATAMIFITSIVRSQSTDRTNAVAANQLADFATAAATHTRNNYATLLAASAGGPITVTPQQLRDANLLPPGFQDTNVYGQTWSAVARRVDASTLETLVITTGGVEIPFKSASDIAGMTAAKGVAGGYTSGANAVGALGSWEVALATFGVSPGEGRLAANLAYTNEAISDTALHRVSIPGRPELNRMSTAIDMSGNDLIAAGQVTANRVDANDVSGTLDHTGGYLRINTYSPAYGAGAARLWYGGTDNALRFDRDTGGRINIATGNVNATGNVQASGNMFANNMFATNNVDAGGSFRTTGNGGWLSLNHGGGWFMNDSTWIRAYGNKSVVTGGEVRAGTLRSTGNVLADGSIEAVSNVRAGVRVTAGEFLLAQSLAVCGSSCAPNRLIGTDDRGRLLTCQGGQWRGHECEPPGGGPGDPPGHCINCDLYGGPTNPCTPVVGGCWCPEPGYYLQCP